MCLDDDSPQSDKSFFMEEANSSEESLNDNFDDQQLEVEEEEKDKNGESNLSSKKS